MQINESYEDYLKAIYLISKQSKGGWVSNSEISNFLSVKPASVSGMLHKLKENGFISWKPRRSIRLTSQGRIVAKKILNDYNQLQDFFIQVLNINDLELVNKLCCGIEHHITPEVVEGLKELSNIE